MAEFTPNILLVVIVDRILCPGLIYQSGLETLGFDLFLLSCYRELTNTGAYFKTDIAWKILQNTSQLLLLRFLASDINTNEIKPYIKSEDISTDEKNPFFLQLAPEVTGICQEEVYNEDDKKVIFQLLHKVETIWFCFHFKS